MHAIKAKKRQVITQVCRDLTLLQQLCQAMPMHSMQALCNQSSEVLNPGRLTLPGTILRSSMPMFTARMSVTLDSGLDSTWRVSGAWKQAQSERDTDGDERLMQHCGLMSPGLCCASGLRDKTCTLGSRSGHQLQWLHQGSGGRLDSERLSGPGCTGNNVVMARVSVKTARASHTAHCVKTRAADSTGPE